MKKLLIIFCFLILVFTIDVNAAEKSVFTVNSASGEPGSEVTVSINLNNTSKYQSLGFVIPLNSLMVEYVSCKVHGFESATMKNCGFNTKHEVTFYAIDASDDLLNDNGKILDVKLRIKENIHEDIPISLNINNFSKSSKEKLEYDIVNGIIKTNGTIDNTQVDNKESLGNEVAEDVQWYSSDDSVAKVDSDGNVEFKDIGNTTITAKNKNGKTVYEKSYQVNKKEKKSMTKYYIIGGVILLFVVIGAGIIFFIKKKRK